MPKREASNNFSMPLLTTFQTPETVSSSCFSTSGVCMERGEKSPSEEEEEEEEAVVTETEKEIEEEILLNTKLLQCNMFIKKVFFYGK